MWDVTMLTSQTRVKGEIENLSPEGAFILCDEIPPLEGNFLLVMEVPEHKTMSIRAKVTWSTVFEINSGDSLLGVGVQFTNMSEKDRQFLHSTIAKEYQPKTNRNREKE
jgi:Tfp pilus assembly protein PilZ